MGFLWGLSQGLHQLHLMGESTIGQGVECGFFPRSWELKHPFVPAAKRFSPYDWFPGLHLALLPAQHALPVVFCACVQPHIHYGKEGPLMQRKL